MQEDIRLSINAKIDHIRNYFEVPASVEAELDELQKSMESIAADAENVMDFENKLAGSSVGQNYFELFSRLTPKAAEPQNTAKLTAEAYQKMYASTDKKTLAKEAIKEAADTVAVEMKEEAISRRRRAMIESGTFDDYTRMTNKVEDAGRVIGALGKLIKKK